MPQKLILLSCAVLVGTAALAADNAGTPSAYPLLKSHTVVWVGLDYSMVRMYGTQDFRQPEEIFPKMLDSWNSLFLTELVFHTTARLQVPCGQGGSACAEETPLVPTLPCT